MGNTSSAILIYLCSTIVGILLGALVLQFATKWVAGFKPKYPIALLAQFVSYLACYAIGFLVGFCVVTVTKAQLTGATMFFILFGCFFAQTAFYALIIKDTDRKPLPYGKACLVSLIQVIFAAAILAAIFGVMTINKNVKANDAKGEMSTAEYFRGVPINMTTTAVANDATISLAKQTADNEFDGQKRLAENGDVIAQYNLGVCYHNGQGVPQDYMEAVKWFRKAADQGNAFAQFALGFAYAKGQGVPQDYEGAVKWYRRAADQNDAGAQDDLGAFYRDGRGVATNFVEAYKWFNLASANGYVNPIYTKLKEDTTRLETALGPGFPPFNLGDARIYPDATTERDAIAALMTPDQIAEGQRLSREFQPHKESAAENLNRAQFEDNKAKAENCDATAQLTLGYCYYNGQGMATNLVEAAKWFRRAADQGNAGGQSCLGYCYYNGWGVPTNLVEAAKWSRKAADQGFAPAECFVGINYATGIGVATNLVEAVKWFRKAADQGDAGGQYSLGYFYCNGAGVETNAVEGYKWCSLASAQGNEPAKKILAILEKRMTPDQIAEAQRLSREFQPHKESASGNSK